MRDALRRGTEYVLLLNNDTIVAPDFLSQLVRVAESDAKIARRKSQDIVLRPS